MSDVKNQAELERLWEADDTPPTDEMLANLQPMPEATKEIFRRARGAQRAPTKQLVSLRIDRDVIERYRASGEGWQGRINDALRRSVGL